MSPVHEQADRTEPFQGGRRRRGPASGSASGGTGIRCSPETRSNPRLVASTVRPGAAPRSSTSSGPAAGRCSTLSRINSIVRGSRYADRSPTAVSSPTCSPRTRAIVAATRPASPTGASGTNATAANPISSVEATSMANRVLPTPPGPVSVTSRATRSSSRSRSAAASRSRPTIGVSGTGRSPTHAGRPTPAVPGRRSSSRSDPGAAAIPTGPPRSARAARDIGGSRAIPSVPTTHGRRT